jgi:hypothetical protein
MSRTMLLLFALAAGLFAAAQVKPIQIQKPSNTQVRQQAPAVNMQMDEATLLRRDVQKLRSEVQDLKNQVAALRQSQADHPRCSSPNVSSSSLGERNCGEFLCDNATGTCISSCNSSNDCRGGAVCDMGVGRCVVP